MLIVRNEDELEHNDTIRCETEECDISDLYENINIVNNYIMDLDVKKHALVSTFDLSNRIDSDDEYLNMYAASEAMGYARLAGVANEITVGDEGFFGVIYKVISSIFKAIIALITKILEFIENIFKAIFGFLNHDDVDTPKGREEKVKNLEERFKDTIEEIYKAKAKGYTVSDTYSKSQEAVIEAKEKEVLDMANKNLAVRAYTKGIDADNTISLSSIIGAYNDYIESLDQVSSRLNDSKGLDILNIAIQEHHKNNKATNLTNIITNYLEQLKSIEAGDYNRADELAIDNSSEIFPSIVTLVNAMVKLIGKRKKFRNYDPLKVLSLLSTHLSERVRDNVREFIKQDRSTRNEVFIAITNKAIYTLSSEVENIKSVEVEDNIEDIINKLSEKLERVKGYVDKNDTETTAGTVIRETVSILHDLVLISVYKLNRVGSIEELELPEAKSVSTDELNQYDFKHNSVKDTLIVKAFEYYTRELQFATKLKSVEKELKSEKRVLENENKKLKQLEKDVESMLKGAGEKSLLTDTINELVKSIETITTIHANNFKNISSFIGELSISYTSSKFNDICLGILDLYYNKLIQKPNI